LTIDLVAAKYTNRFSLQFHDETLNVKESFLENGIQIIYADNEGTLNIHNSFQDTQVTGVLL
jgi:hypothetical protein